MSNAGWKNPTTIGATIGAIAVILAAFITLWGGKEESQINQQVEEGGVAVGGNVEGPIHIEK